jgi:hypothetical protein
MTPFTAKACNPLRPAVFADAKNSPEIKGFAKPERLG